jgi:hypothetical protein
MKLEKLGPVGAEEFSNKGARRVLSVANALLLSERRNCYYDVFAAKTRMEFIRVRFRAIVSCASAAASVCRE